MTYIPRLYTPRLCLRPFDLADAPRVHTLVSDKQIALLTAAIPHPMTARAVVDFIQSRAPLAALGKEFTFAVTLTGTRTPGREHDRTDTGYLIGCVSLGSAGEPGERLAELGYWIGQPFWNKGFGTEAARAVIDFGFVRRHLDKISARHVAENAASERTLQKLSFACERIEREQEFRGQKKTIATHGLSYGGWEQSRKPHKLVFRPELQLA